MDDQLDEYILYMQAIDLKEDSIAKNLLLYPAVLIDFTIWLLKKLNKAI